MGIKKKNPYKYEFNILTEELESVILDRLTDNNAREFIIEKLTSKKISISDKNAEITSEMKKHKTKKHISKEAIRAFIKEKKENLKKFNETLEFTSSQIEKYAGESPQEGSASIELTREQATTLGITINDDENKDEDKETITVDAKTLLSAKNQDASITIENSQAFLKLYERLTHTQLREIFGFDENKIQEKLDVNGTPLVLIPREILARFIDKLGTRRIPTSRLREEYGYSDQKIKKIFGIKNVKYYSRQDLTNLGETNEKIKEFGLPVELHTDEIHPFNPIPVARVQLVTLTTKNIEDFSDSNIDPQSEQAGVWIKRDEFEQLRNDKEKEMTKLFSYSVQPMGSHKKMTAMLYCTDGPFTFKNVAKLQAFLRYADPNHNLGKLFTLKDITKILKLRSHHSAPAFIASSSSLATLYATGISFAAKYVFGAVLIPLPALLVIIGICVLITAVSSYFSASAAEKAEVKQLRDLSLQKLKIAKINKTLKETLNNEVNTKLVDDVVSLLEKSNIKGIKDEIDKVKKEKQHKKLPLLVNLILNNKAVLEQTQVNDDLSKEQRLALKSIINLSEQLKTPDATPNPVKKAGFMNKLTRSSDRVTTFLYGIRGSFKAGMGTYGLSIGLAMILGFQITVPIIILFAIGSLIAGGIHFASTYGQRQNQKKVDTMTNGLKGEENEASAKHETAANNLKLIQSEREVLKATEKLPIRAKTLKEAIDNVLEDTETTNANKGEAVKNSEDKQEVELDRLTKIDVKKFFKSIFNAHVYMNDNKDEKETLRSRLTNKDNVFGKWSKEQNTFKLNKGFKPKPEHLRELRDIAKEQLQPTM